MRRQRTRVLLAAGACAIGFACGEMAARRGPAGPLAPAGSARDDGRGWLARMSRRAVIGAPGRPAQTTYGGARYGGQSYGAARYGGTLYGNYRFDFSGPHVDAPSPYRPGYVASPVTAGGTVEGTVLWPDAPRAAERIAVARAGCPREVANRTLARGAGHVTANAVIYLEDIARGRQLLGRSWPYPPTRVHQIGGALEWRGCRLRPDLQLVAPIGAMLSVVSADAPVALAGTRIEGARRELLFQLRLEAAGAGRELLLVRDGFIEVRGEVGPPAWLVVAAHPYYAVSDERGRFVLDDIPAGVYTMVAWHPPVVLGARPDGELVTSEPAVVRRKITVKARQRQRVTVRLPAGR